MFYFSSKDATRRSSSTGYVDYMTVRTNPCELISLFGYNSGADQFLQLYDQNGSWVPGGNHPILRSVTDTNATTNLVTVNGASLTAGDYLGAVYLTGVTGVSFAYAVAISATTVALYPTVADAMAQTNRVDLTQNSETGSFSLVPVHTFAIGATDNYSCIIPVTGIPFGRGLIVAVSTAGPLYTAGAKEVTICGTLKS